MHFDFSADYKGWFEKIPEIIWNVHNAKSHSKVKVNIDRLTEESRFQFNENEEEIPLYYTTHLKTHVSSLYSKVYSNHINLDDSTLSFAKNNSKSDVNNISSMQDIKHSIQRESRSNLVSPFQLNNTNFSFNQLNHTMVTDKNSNDTMNTLNLTRPLTGNSNVSTT